MKIKHILGFAALALVLNVTSCTEEDAENLEDQLPNEDVEGDDREPYVGTWTVAEQSKLLGARAYSVNVSKDAAFPQRVFITNFYLLGTTDTVKANVSTVAPNIITIPFQTLKSNYIGGDGSLASGKISFKYTIDDGNGLDTVTAVYSK